MMQQPVHRPVVSQAQREWDSGVLSCFEDISTCCHGYICMCCLLCSVANKLGEKGSLTVLCVPGAMTAIRTRLRTLFGIQGTICDDCIVTTMCGPCAVCQMDRELKAMGL